MVEYDFKDRVLASLIVLILALLPLIPIILIWFAMHPVGFIQNAVMLFISIFLYPLFAFIEIIVLAVIT